MKEIKFRAWDKYEKFMHYNAEQCYDDVGTKSTPYLGDSFGELLDNENIVLMQFTGLKDKNGKEIYEGDIIKLSEHYSGDEFVKEYNGEIQFGEAEFFISKKNGDGFGDELAGNNMNKRVEIIGNIYKNPGLLE